MSKADTARLDARETNRGDNHLAIPPDALAFDIDGVVADTMALFLEIASDDFGINTIRYEDIVSYSLEDCLDLDRAVLEDIVRKLLDGDHSQPLLPVAGAADVLMRLGQGFPPLLFVTARPYAGHQSGAQQLEYSLELRCADAVATRKVFGCV